MAALNACVLWNMNSVSMINPGSGVGCGVVLMTRHLSKNFGDVDEISTSNSINVTGSTHRDASGVTRRGNRIKRSFARDLNETC
jgi:hypothetical protein